MPETSLGRQNRIMQDLLVKFRVLNPAFHPRNRRKSASPSGRKGALASTISLHFWHTCVSS
jgi:hypothetical protein